jgi:hypothetical protein
VAILRSYRGRVVRLKRYGGRVATLKLIPDGGDFGGAGCQQDRFIWIIARDQNRSCAVATTVARQQLQVL